MKANVQSQGTLFLKAKQRDQTSLDDMKSSKRLNNISRPGFLQLIILSTLVFGIVDVTFASAYRLQLRLNFYRN